MLGAKTPEEFSQVVSEQNSELMNFASRNAVSQSVNLIKEALGAYHSQMIAPNLKSFDGLMSQAQQVQQRNNWDGAFSDLKAKYADADKYAEAIKTKLLKDPKWTAYKTALNQSHAELAEQGITHQNVLEELYQLVSINDRIESAKIKASPSVGGLKSGSKHITTAKADGLYWDEIEENFWK